MTSPSKEPRTSVSNNFSAVNNRNNNNEFSSNGNNFENKSIRLGVAVPGHFQHKDLVVKERASSLKPRRCKYCNIPISLQYIEQYLIENDLDIYNAKAHVIKSRWVAWDVPDRPIITTAVTHDRDTKAALRPHRCLNRQQQQPQIKRGVVR